jgi:hypothetical protein
MVTDTHNFDRNVKNGAYNLSIHTHVQGKIPEEGVTD